MSSPESLTPPAELVTPDAAFLKEVEERCGQPISPCFHCFKCSSGCPVTFAMDHLPNKVVRMVQMGLRAEVLQSSTIWLCASCETCSTRCPNDVDIAHLMDVLREIALESGVKPAEPRVPLFHQSFLESVQAGGRVHELGMLMRYKQRTGELFKDAGLGWEMFKRGKLKLLPSKVRDRGKVKEIFERSKGSGRSN
jgi:heterodisulfide reductase subunit C